MSIELVNICPVCKGTVFVNKLSCKDYTYSQKNFTIQQCKSCQLLLTNPRPDQESIGKFYQSPDYISHSGKSNSFFDFIYLRARKIALGKKHKLITRYRSQGSILDFGCGTGEFLKFMETRNWNANGVEPSENARAKASQLIGDKNSHVFENLKELQALNFDVITLWHVLEHVPDPALILTSLKKLLNKDGYIFVAVPNHKSHDADFYKEHWAGYDVPRHFWHFTPLQMEKLLESQGLKLVDKQPMKMDAYYVSLLSEKNKNNGKHNLITPINASIRGLISNVKGKKTMNYSSLIYIARHE